MSPLAGSRTIRVPSLAGSRRAVPEASRRRSLRQGMACFLPALVIYLGLSWLLALGTSWWWRLPAASLVGLSIAVLFVIGHDAVHGSLTPHARWNHFFGVVCLLPSYHTVSAWAYSHNTLHHGWTNLRTRDPVYPPLTVEEYRGFSKLQRVWHRMLRTLPGLGLLYLGEIWVPYQIAPSGGYAGEIRRRGAYDRERWYVISWFACLCLFGAAGAAIRVGGWPGLGAALTGVAWMSLAPFVVWSWLMGWATYQHHTHPRVRWYDDLEEWKQAQTQLTATVHVDLPRWADRILHNIMDHTAHHLDPKVPLYELRRAQVSVEERFPRFVVVERFSLKGLVRTLGICRLYSYRTHTWLDWDGTPLASAG